MGRMQKDQFRPGRGMWYCCLSDHLSAQQCVLSPWMCGPGEAGGGPAFGELVFQKGAQVPTAQDRHQLSVGARHSPLGDRIGGGLEPGCPPALPARTGRRKA